MSLAAAAGVPDWREDWERLFYSAEAEEDYDIENIEGQLPAGLRGCFWRTGPGAFERAGQKIEPVDGDGMVVRVSFDGKGGAHFTNRFIETEGYVAERAAGKLLHRGVFGTLPPQDEHLRGKRQMPQTEGSKGPKNTANTALLLLPKQGRMLAMWEGGMPHSIDPQTLATHGVDTLAGALPGDAVFSAHPCYDAATQRVVNFGVHAGVSPVARLFEIDVAGAVPQIVQRHTVKLRGQAVIHDCCLTASWMVLVHNPVKLDMKGMTVGASIDDFMVGEPSPKARTRVYLVPRDPALLGGGGGGVNTRVAEYELPAAWNSGAAGFTYHHCGAWEEASGDVVVDSVVYRQKPPLDMRSTAPGSNPMNHASATGGGRLMRVVLPRPRAAGRFTAAAPRLLACSPHCCEMPVVRGGRVGQRHRYVYAVDTLASADGQARPWAAVVKCDLDAQQQTRWEAPPRCFVGEPAFAPRRAAAAAAEDSDDGWLVVAVTDCARRRSAVVVLDARDLARGPVCTLPLRRQVPFSHHTMWTPEYFGPAGGGAPPRPPSAKL